MSPVKETTSSRDDVVRIGLISRIDYGRDGFRVGLLELAREIFAYENVHFVILAGGLISGHAIAERRRKCDAELRLLVRHIKEQIVFIKKLEEAEIKGDLDSERRKLASMDADKESLEKKLASLTPEAIAEYLKDKLPQFVNAGGERVRLYIVTSPAYDGRETAKKVSGEIVARLLSQMREDIRVWKHGGDRFDLKQVGKNLETLTAEKTPWRGDYDSTAVERTLRDKRKQSSQSLPDLDVVGSFGVTITKPQGEIDRPYATVPACHRTEEVTASENQIGVRVMEVIRGRTDPVLRNYPFKDVIANERLYIEPPANMTPTLQKIVEALKTRGRLTTGLLSDATGLKRETIEKKLFSVISQKRGSKKSWPGIVYDEAAERWDFDLEWMQEKLRYPSIIAQSGEKDDSIVAFGCSHFGSVHTDCEAFLKYVPKVMIERRARVLVCAGDVIEGLKHNLALRGEIYLGMNLTQQEEFAGEMIGEVRFRAFSHFFSEALAQNLPEWKKLDPGSAALQDAVARKIRDCLDTFNYIPGNHDLWATDFGVTPLTQMVTVMADHMVKKIEPMLAKEGLLVRKLKDLVLEKTVQGPRFRLPSGLCMDVKHPHMGRSKTTSIRPQEMLAASDCQVVIGANFHVGEHIEKWQPDLGQRVCLQIGTMKHRTEFEDNKLKIVDFGFAYLRVTSREGRIVRTECTFESQKVQEGKLDNVKAYDEFRRALGLIS